MSFNPPLINSASHREIIALAETLFTNHYHLTYELINHCCVELAIEFLDQILLINNYSEKQTSSETRAYQYQTVLDILHEEELVSFSSSQTQWHKLPSKKWTQANCQRLCQQGAEEFPESKAMFDLIALCHEGMASFLTGQKSGVDVLFPRGDESVWYRYNNENTIITVYPQLVAKVISCYPQQNNALNILEVGAGTGAGTNAIVAAMGNRIGNYLYTDIGTTFLRRGRERFGNFSYFKYKKLDINISLIEQEIDPNSIDVLVGTNVVHTAKNLEQTLCFLKQVIKPEGWLLLGEGSPPSSTNRWKPDIIFGFLDGWWDVTITQNRPRPGFLTPNEWRQLLQNTGFVSIQTFPGEDFFKPAPCYGGVVIGVNPAVD